MKFKERTLSLMKVQRLGSSLFYLKNPKNKLSLHIDCCANLFCRTTDITETMVNQKLAGLLMVSEKLGFPHDKIFYL